MSEKKLAWEHPCPQCGGPLWPVTNTGYLNDEQFDSVKCGEAYCATCKDPTTRSGYRYFWARDFAAPPPEERAPSGEAPERKSFEDLMLQGMNEVVDIAEGKREPSRVNTYPPPSADATAGERGPRDLGPLDTVLDYVRATEYWQLAPHDQKERHAYFARSDLAEGLKQLAAAAAPCAALCDAIDEALNHPDLTADQRLDEIAAAVAAPCAECARLREDVELLRHIALEYAVEARYIESRKHGKSWLYRLGYTDSWFDTREGALAEYIRRAALRAPSTQREE